MVSNVCVEWHGPLTSMTSFVELEVVGATKCSIFCPCPCPHGIIIFLIVLAYKSSTNTIKYIKYESGIYDNNQNSLIYYCWAICPAMHGPLTSMTSFVELEVVGAAKCSIFCPCPCPHAFSVGVNNYWPVWPTQTDRESTSELHPW
jgi:hypothetical protein